MQQFLPVPAALAVAVAFIDVPSAQARGQGHFGVASPAHFGVQRVQPARVLAPQVRPHLTVQKTVKFHTDHPVKHARINRLHNNNGKQAKLLSNGSKKARVTSYHQRMHKPLAGSMTTFKGNLPQHIKPKFTVTKTLNAQVQKRLHPFVEKYWKRPFVWLAFADFGYITVPELYYDRFLACIEDDEYDRCIYLLSRAAVEEEEPVARVRYKMPATAVYRYAAKLAPSEVAQAAVKRSPTAAS